MSDRTYAPPRGVLDRTAEAERPGNGGSRLGRLLLGGPDDPRWARPALWAVMVLAAALYTYGLGANGDANSYYAAAVLSGTKSWTSFFFGSLDTGNFITVDKPPVALWLMGLSCRVFGFGTWQMLLPMAASGVASVAVLYSAVRRVFGYAAATVAALVMALTPITVAITRDNNPDPVLVLLCVCAAWFLLEAVRSGKLLPLVWSAVLVGFAFNAKMLQAFIVLPAFFVTYLFAAPGRIGRRIRHILAAGVALVVSTGWWMVTVDSIPAADRPFIGSSTKNSIWDLATGYNGLARILGKGGGKGGGRGDAVRHAGGTTTDAVHQLAQTAAGRAGGGGRGGFGGSTGISRLFSEQLGGQISWLLPFAAVALISALVLRGRRPRTDWKRAALVLWGVWMLTHFVTFSYASGTFHPYYTTMLTPSVAALTGAGGVALLRAVRRGSVWAGVLAAAVLGSAAWAVVLLRRTPDFASWLWPLIALAGLVAVVALLVGTAREPRAAVPRRGRRLLPVGAVTALVALLAGPAAYATDTVAAGAIQGSNPMGGPSSRTGGFGGFGGLTDLRPGLKGQYGHGAYGGLGRFMGGGGHGGADMMEQLRTSRGFGGGRGGSTSPKLISYLERHQGGAKWLVATSNATSAARIILATGGKAALAMGGFTGSDPAMTVTKFLRYVSSGRLHYVLAGGGAFGGGFGGGRGGGTSQVMSYVQTHCSAVPASAYGGTATSATSLRTAGSDTSGTFGGASRASGASPRSAGMGRQAAGSGRPDSTAASQTLYDCTG
ncbi:glycosyltransferase family 39 protein [Streptomyces sp. DG2A-72]|uniref:ArnT family glycosyltransferase n=1 Tax=Streptomyces sp. DG2A-72 TaxID=3051386 RepID=UPI00265BB7B3|nr:glycosyltransferase family 39 protein [Streptomyces sp. DG2A-72]MDO0935254.1 glycosyltransferase family 39 protein [Streptomyces sp. DG2A-72]